MSSMCWEPLALMSPWGFFHRHREILQQQEEDLQVAHSLPWQGGLCAQEAEAGHNRVTFQGLWGRDYPHSPPALNTS